MRWGAFTYGLYEKLEDQILKYPRHRVMQLEMQLKWQKQKRAEEKAEKEKMRDKLIEQQ